MKTNKTIVAPAQSVESPSAEQTGHTPNPQYLPETSIQPTATPWRVVRTPQAFRIYSQPMGLNQQGIEIASTYLAGLEDKTNANLIVRAVNSHAALLEAAKQLDNYLALRNHHPESYPRNVLLAAIKRAD